MKTEYLSMYNQAPTQQHAHTHTQANTHTHIHKYTHAHIYKHVHIHTYTHLHIYTTKLPVDIIKQYIIRCTMLSNESLNLVIYGNICGD